jgi:NAD(P)-dependent dehydrogenase (short-subunit alcohol dehydrogenase family)
MNFNKYKNLKMTRLKDKIIVITGGVNGIGKVTCELLCKEGANVIITDILDEDGMLFSKKLQNEKYICTYYHMDVSNENNIKSVFNIINNTFGYIDILINNAGIIGVNKQTHEITEKEWDDVININVKGVFFCTKYAIPLMIKNKKGSIINMSSIFGIIGTNNVPPYHASKGAIRIMTKTDAITYAHLGIRVNSIHPGYIWTSMSTNFLNITNNNLNDIKNDFCNKQPLNCIGEPIDVAYGILYLASDESKFVTGTELVIDGGYTAR